jgi:iron complex outermembrane recepter protein
MSRLSLLAKVCRSLALSAAVAAGCAAQPSSPDLTQSSLEDLLNIEVTSVSKKEQRLSAAAAAVYVITRDDIRRSGLTSIPELLRLVPGLNVARIDANKWAVSARGNNSRFANKLLVLVDGRSVYTPLFAGVYWDVQDVVLEDVERIEVIRGPGATVWGANAVNGVINIITRQAKETEGGLVVAGGGTEERGFGTFRFGGKAGEEGHYRFYGKYFDRGGLLDAQGREAADRWRALRGGFRADWAAKKDSFTVQGDIYQGYFGQTSVMPTLQPPYQRVSTEEIDAAGGNLLGRWSRVISEKSDLSLQVYYDQTKRVEATTGESRRTLDFDFQHRYATGRHEMVWGLGYRRISDALTDSFFISFKPGRETYRLASAFVQDEISLLNDGLKLTLGSKFEHNSYTGFNAQPNARLAWTPRPQHTLWAAVSRAVRTPSRAERSARLNVAVLPGPQPGVPNVLSLIGSRDFKPEELLAQEVGYRVQPHGRVSFDFAAFSNRYRGLLSVSPGQPYLEMTPTSAQVTVPFYAGNGLRARSYGGEVSANVKASDRWRLSAWYAFLRTNSQSPGSDAGAREPVTGGSPNHQAQVRSYLQLPRGFEFDSSLSYVGPVRAMAIPGYLRLDARIGWRVAEAVELSVGAQNLLDPHHPEFGSWLNEQATEARRGVYGKVTWQF